MNKSDKNTAPVSASPLLDKLTGAPGELACFSYDQLNALCAEIRAFLVDSVSRTGGHLASNLGIVEISVALQLEFDPFRDRILYDVGHQSYVHKLLTGRREGFSVLRQYGGMAGFPRPWESPADPVVAGHASAAISAASGIARARTLLHDDYHVVAVVGDGALSGGMALEALNDIGRSDEPVIVVLNDNAKSISDSVGAIADYLTRIRTRPSYYRFKTFVQRVVGERFGGFLRRLKNRVKTLLLPTSIIEALGFSYLGPVDGHDIRRVRELLAFAKLLNKPVVIHCVTVKGRGCAYAERDPGRFHGAAAFDSGLGREVKTRQMGFSDVFGETLTQFARKDARICAVTAAMPSGTGLTQFSREFPTRFFDVGIAEQHAVTMSAGLAKAGMLPVCAVYSTFLQRAYDQIIHDVAIEGLHVVFGVDRAGLVGEDGETHQGVFDVQYLTGIPGLTLYAPASCAELRTVLRRALCGCTGPVALRYPKGTDGIYQDNHPEDVYILRDSFPDGAAETHGTVKTVSHGGSVSGTRCAGSSTGVISHGDSVTLLSYGGMINEVLGAADVLTREGIPVRVVKLLTLKPLPDVTPYLRGALVIVEDVVPCGSVGEAVLSRLALAGMPIRARHLHTGDGFVPCGSVAKLREVLGIDAAGIAKAARELLGR